MGRGPYRSDMGAGQCFTMSENFSDDDDSSLRRWVPLDFMADWHSHSGVSQPESALRRCCDVVTSTSI